WMQAGSSGGRAGWLRRNMLALPNRPPDAMPIRLGAEYARREEQSMLPLSSSVRPPRVLSRVLALSFRCGSTRGLDRIGGPPELGRGDMCDRRSLASSVRGMFPPVSFCVRECPPVLKAHTVGVLSRPRVSPHVPGMLDTAVTRRESGVCNRRIPRGT